MTYSRAIHLDHMNNRVTREFLSFCIGGEEYGLDLLSVQEIRGYEQCTHLAGAPNFVKGIVNLRGTIVPILDMRLRFGVAAPTYDVLTVVIILNVEDRTIGMVVDSVKDVVALPSEQIRPAPEFGKLDMDSIIGVATLEDGMVILLDIEHLLMEEEFGLPA